MTESKQRLFIYDRREMIILVLLAVMIALFSFTLGVHMGKSIGAVAQVEPDSKVDVVETVGDPIPSRQELTDQSKDAIAEVETELDRSLEKEVKDSGIQLDKPIQTALPEIPKSRNAGATTPTQPTSVTTPKFDLVHEAGSKIAFPFTLQIGSYKTLNEASKVVQDLEKQGVNPSIRPVRLKDKGQWYRVTLGEYPSREEASLAGVRYRARNLITSYMVAKIPESK